MVNAIKEILKGRDPEESFAGIIDLVDRRRSSLSRSESPPFSS